MTSSLVIATAKLHDANDAAANYDDVGLGRRLGIGGHGFNLGSHVYTVRFIWEGGHRAASTVQLIGISATLAVLGRSSAKATILPMSSGWVRSSGLPGAAAAMLVAT